MRSRIDRDELAGKVGKIITADDFNVVLTGPTRVVKPDGTLLCVYLPGAIPPNLRELAYGVLHTIRAKTQNRGYASGSRRVKSGEQADAVPVMSSVIGNFDPMGGRFPYCRTTAWTGAHADEFRSVFPVFRWAAELFERYVPDRYRVQMRYVNATKPDWRIADTPYSTMTVNNTYPTGVHKDAGDLHEGFSNLFCLRRGNYRGGVLTFPEFRIGADLRDGDLILMDAHEWHGNTGIDVQSEDAERITTVLYFRTNMVNCGTMEEEIARAQHAIDNGLSLDDLDPEVRDTITTRMHLE